MSTRRASGRKARPGTVRRPRRGARPDLGRRLGWALTAVGILLFVSGYVGALTGLALLPFDLHHVIGQLGGALLAILGVIWAASR